MIRVLHFSSLKKTELQTLENENEIIGLLLSSKAIVQLFMNPLVGVLTSYVGYNVPIMLGSILLIVISVCKYNYYIVLKVSRFSQQHFTMIIVKINYIFFFNNWTSDGVWTYKPIFSLTLNGFHIWIS